MFAFPGCLCKVQTCLGITQSATWPTQNPHGEKSGGRTNNGEPDGIKFLFFSMKCERCIAYSFAETANKYPNCDFRAMLCMKAKLSLNIKVSYFQMACEVPCS